MCCVENTLEWNAWWMQCVTVMQKVSVFVLSVVRIYPHSNWIPRFTEQISIFIPNVVKYGPEKLQYRQFLRSVFSSCSIVQLAYQSHVNFLFYLVLVFLQSSLATVFSFYTYVCVMSNGSNNLELLHLYTCFLYCCDKFPLSARQL